MCLFRTGDMVVLQGIGSLPPSRDRPCYDCPAIWSWRHKGHDGADMTGAGRSVITGGHIGANQAIDDDGHDGVDHG